MILSGVSASCVVSFNFIHKYILNIKLSAGSHHASIKMNKIIQKTFSVRLLLISWVTESIDKTLGDCLK